MAAVGMLLLVGCANLANLALARGTGREREVVVRAALGASRARLVRQFLTESLVLSFAGGLLGLAVGYGMMRGLQLLLPPLYLPREAERDHRRAGAAVCARSIVLTGLIFGTAPAFQAGRIDFAGSMKGIVTDRHRRSLPPPASRRPSRPRSCARLHAPGRRRTADAQLHAAAAGRDDARSRRG